MSMVVKKVLSLNLKGGQRAKKNTDADLLEFLLMRTNVSLK